MSIMPIGQVVPRIGPPLVEHTTRIPAGLVTFGVELRQVELRRLDEDVADGDSPQLFPDGGISIHVWDSANDGEYLRFDCFAENPHYHYIWPETPHYVVVRFDEHADGDDMLGWVVERLRRRLPMMLRNSGGAHLAELLDPAELTTAIDAVETLARDAALAAQTA